MKLAKIPGALPPLLGTDEYEANLQSHSGGGVFGDVSSNSGGVNPGSSSGNTPFGFIQGSTRNSSPRSQGGSSSVMGPLMGNYDPNSSERFSRKVFVGGLPPDIDEGNVQCKVAERNSSSFLLFIDYKEFTSYI